MRGIVAAVIAATIAMTVAVPTAAQPLPEPSLPPAPGQVEARFYGRVYITSVPAPVGTVIAATVGDTLCGQTTVRQPGSYVLDVVSATTTPGCGTEGAAVAIIVIAPTLLTTLTDLPEAMLRTGALIRQDLPIVSRGGTPRAPGLGPEWLPLLAGCTNVVLTWPDGTSLRTIAASVTLPEVTRPAGLAAIWRLDPATGRYLGWSPAPNAPNDLETVNHLDAVFICIDAPGAIDRPPN